MKYIPSGKDEFVKMMKDMGIGSFEELITHIPKHLRDRDTGLPDGISEYEMMLKARETAKTNKNTNDYISFMGCGIYDHYIPPGVRHIALRPEFYTAYTPYQAEVSQGTLQVIYEFQSMICELYDMDISNASMYDGASAAAEACHMAMNVTSKKRILISDMVHPAVKEVIGTYLKGMDIEYHYIRSNNGITDVDDLKSKINSSTAAFLVQTPNVLGLLEQMDEIERIVHDSEALLIVSQNPVSLGIINPPGFYNADIAVGEAQPLGIHQAFGGPLLGIFTAKKEFSRLMPGRIIGKTEDTKGREGYVMTLQTREQHIRREKATSNICTNEGLCLLMATVYMALLGKEGFYEVSRNSSLSAHYMNERLKEIDSIELPYEQRDFYNEFPVIIKNLKSVQGAMKSKGYLMGVNMGKIDPDKEDMLLIACTEKRTKEEIDGFIEALKGAVK